jgi:hypothetical protein
LKGGKEGEGVMDKGGGSKERRGRKEEGRERERRGKGEGGKGREFPHFFFTNLAPKKHK